MEPIPSTDYLWAELRWSARAEGVCHLDDLLLRRTRLGLILPHAAESILPQVKLICLAELKWSEAVWQQELGAYLALWNQNYALPEPASIPDWRVRLAEIKSRRFTRTPSRRVKILHRSGILASVVMLCAAILSLRWLSQNRRTR